MSNDDSFNYSPFFCLSRSLSIFLSLNIGKHLYLVGYSLFLIWKKTSYLTNQAHIIYIMNASNLIVK